MKTINNNQINDNTIEPINNNKIKDNTIETKKSKFDRKIWNQNNLDKIAAASRRHYDAHKNDIEYKNKRKMQAKARRDRIKQEKLLNNPPIVKEPVVEKEKGPERRGRPRKHP
jgi:ABC-type proline/glycine betaine transport system substrate-binding protein